MSTDPPFTTPRPAVERVALFLRDLPPDAGWAFSGSAIRWAASLEQRYDLIVFLQLDPVVRLERLRQLEISRYGARISPGGDMAAASIAFLHWAASYVTAGPEQCSLSAHEEWLARQAAPALRLDSDAPVRELLAAVQAFRRRR